ncbi:hypothetical protein ACLOJK_016589 [Asimina triloba]
MGIKQALGLELIRYRKAHFPAVQIFHTCPAPAPAFSPLIQTTGFAFCHGTSTVSTSHGPGLFQPHGNADAPSCCRFPISCSFLLTICHSSNGQRAQSFDLLSIPKKWMQRQALEVGRRWYPILLADLKLVDLGSKVDGKFSLTAAETLRAEFEESVGDLAAEAFKEFKHMLLPITDPNPYLSEGTRQAAATATTMAKKYGSDITVVVIDEKPKDSRTEHDTQLSSIRWHLSEGGFQEFGLMERLGEGKKPTAIIGEVADEMSMDLVVLSMEAIHSKHVDANLLAEFIPCPVLLLPL